jgi:hypothetical protein
MLIAVLIPLLAGCAATRSAYYNAWEKFGYAKRERLVDNVKKARQEQVEAKKQFTTTLEQFKAVTNFQGGDLEKTYNKLSSEYNTCETQAQAVRDKVQKVKNVAQALFTEWEGEIGQIKDDAALQAQSRELLDKTRGNYKEMIDRMDKAAASMDPVLTKFKNRVLSLKHNLNAQAIASLRGTEGELNKDIDKLIKDMEASIAEADEFIKKLNG